MPTIPGASLKQAGLYYDKGGYAYNVKHPDFGAKGDWNGSTGTDDTNAIKAMITATLNGDRVEWPAGTYLVTDTLVDGEATMLSCSWHGARTERGTDAEAFRHGYAKTKIVFRPSDTSKPLFRVYKTALPGNFLGPYEFENITFDIGDANGLVMGVEDISAPSVIAPANPPALIEADGQWAIFGFRLINSAVIATDADRDSVLGVLTRTGRRMISMSHCFEAVIEDVSLKGCDTQVRAYGCDRPTFRNIRSQKSHLPFDMVGSGNLRAQHTIDNFQCEGWTFTPIRVMDLTVAASKLRLEQNDNYPTRPHPVGSGRFALPGTVSVTADSNTLRFSQSMSGILFPYLSIVELSDGTNTLQVLVATVNRSVVTFDNRATVCNWTASAARATRIHGYGPVQMSQFHSTFDSISASASLNCPAFVYVVDQGQMSICGAGDAFGNFGNIRSMILGNVLRSGLGKMNSQMIFTACEPDISPEPGHPFAVVQNYRQTYGWHDDDNRRRPTQRLDEVIATARRVWAWSPASTGTPGSLANSHPVVRVAVDPNTSEMEWAWHKRTNSGISLLMDDGSLLSDPTALIRLRFRARAVAGTASIDVFFSGNGGGTSLATIIATTTVKTYEYILPVPAQWQGVRTGASSVAFGNTGYYLFGVTVEELSMSDRGHFAAGVGTMVKVGQPTDADFSSSKVENGTIVLDSNGRLWIRNSGTWEVYGTRAAVSDDRGDQDVTLIATDAPTQRFATALTANRTVTLPGGGGTRWRIVRTGLGAGTLNVHGLKTIPAATAAFVDVEFDAAERRYWLTGYGLL